MIKTNASGGIVVEVNDQVYSLSNTEQYTAFLMWLTSPDDVNAIPADAFKVDPNLSDELEAKATRYSHFLEDFAERREAKLAELEKSLTAEQRESAIDKFITELKGEDE